MQSNGMPIVLANPEGTVQASLQIHGCNRRACHTGVQTPALVHPPIVLVSVDDLLGGLLDTQALGQGSGPALSSGLQMGGGGGRGRRDEGQWCTICLPQ